METARASYSKLSPGEKMRQAVRLLMAKGKDAAMDRELNGEFVALIEGESSPRASISIFGDS